MPTPVKEPPTITMCFGFGDDFSMMGAWKYPAVRKCRENVMARWRG